MKNLENLQLQELTLEEQVNTDGGGGVEGLGSGTAKILCEITDFFSTGSSKPATTGSKNDFYYRSGGLK